MQIGNPFYNPENEPTPGAWQYDKVSGRRYRMIGNTKEWEPEILTASAGNIPRADLSRHNEMEEARKEAEKSGAKEREEVDRIKFCPFKSGMGNNCSPRYCALYVSGACALSMIGKSPAAETKGRYCPFTRGKYACNVQCALYEGGCRITAMIGEREENFV